MTTRGAIRQQNAERRLRHQTWDRDQSGPPAWLVVLVLATPFIFAIAGGL